MQQQVRKVYKDNQGHTIHGARARLEAQMEDVEYVSVSNQMPLNPIFEAL